MSQLAMFVSGLPQHRVTTLTREHASAVADVVGEMELSYFGRSETNPPEIIGMLNAPELRGTQGTAGVWSQGRLVAVLLAYDALEHEQGLFLDVFVRLAGDRRQIIDRMLLAARTYADSLSARHDCWLKSDNFVGDTDMVAALAADGYHQHREYLRMRIDFTGPPLVPTLPPGLQASPMTDADWPAIHAVLTRAFRDHYDSHPLPLDLFQAGLDRAVNDMQMWRLIYDGADLVGVRISSTRYAPHGLGYVDSLGVLPQYRGRGIATYLLRDAFAMDQRAGMVGTALHCDATNLTGATRLYEAVGLREDQRYTAWRARIGHPAR